MPPRPEDPQDNDSLFGRITGLPAVVIWAIMKKIGLEEYIYDLETQVAFQRALEEAGPEQFASDVATYLAKVEKLFTELQGKPDDKVALPYFLPVIRMRMEFAYGELAFEVAPDLFLTYDGRLAKIEELPRNLIIIPHNALLEILELTNSHPGTLDTLIAAIRAFHAAP